MLLLNKNEILNLYRARLFRWEDSELWWSKNITDIFRLLIWIYSFCFYSFLFWMVQVRTFCCCFVCKNTLQHSSSVKNTNRARYEIYSWHSNECLFSGYTFWIVKCTRLLVTTISIICPFTTDVRLSFVHSFVFSQSEFSIYTHIIFKYICLDNTYPEREIYASSLELWTEFRTFFFATKIVLTNFLLSMGGFKSASFRLLRLSQRHHHLFELCVCMDNSRTESHSSSFKWTKNANSLLHCIKTDFNFYFM